MFDMGKVGEPKASDTSFVFRFQTRSGTMVTTAADSTPTYRIYAPGSDTVLDSGSTSTAVDSQTGWYKLSINPSSLGFAAGSVYAIRIGYAITSTFHLTAYVLAT